MTAFNYHNCPQTLGSSRRYLYDRDDTSSPQLKVLSAVYATLAQLGERQTEVNIGRKSEGLVFDPQKSHKFLCVPLSVFGVWVLELLF